MPEVKALRYSAGKPQLAYALCFGPALRGVAKVAECGAAKYGRYNFRIGAPASESVDCALRHLLAYWEGVDTDPESNFHHLDHAIWNLMRLRSELETAPPGFSDDRPSGRLHT